MGAVVEDVTIIGAGIVGICCALSLLERGVKVTLIERDEDGRAASFGNSGSISSFAAVPIAMPGAWKKVPRWLLDPKSPLAIRLSHFPAFTPWGIRFLRNSSMSHVLHNSDAMGALAREGVTLYRRHLQGTNQDHLVRDSSTLFAFRNQAHANPNSLDFQLRLRQGAQIELLDSAGLRRAEPDLSPAFQAGIALHGQARADSPGRLRSALESKAIRLGMTLRRGMVNRITPADDGTWSIGITTESAPFSTAAVVVCAGARSHTLLKPLGIKLPLEQEVGYHIQSEDSGVHLNNFVLDADRSVSCSAMTDGLRFTGFAEFRGLDTPPNWKRVQILKQRARSIFPNVKLDRLTEWSGARPSFPDSLPVIGPLPRFRNLFGAFGHAHFGLTMAPATGVAIAELIAHETPHLDLAPYSASRF